jgi:hypothetical protein
MTLFSSAAAAALSDPPDHQSKLLHCYNTRVEFPLKESTSNAPRVLQKLLTKLVGENAGILFYTASGTRLDVEDFPKEKERFDLLFGTTVTKERNQRIIIGFEIRSELPFRKIKTSVWNFLQANAIFMKKHPGPLTKMDIVTLGWVHKAHPTYTSHSTLHHELSDTLRDKLYNLDASEQENFALNADSSVPEFFFSPGRVVGTYAGSRIESNVLFLQTQRSDAKLVRVLIELTFSETEQMAFIPSALKHSDPILFGKYLGLQNAYLENHRNTSIVGISSEALDDEQLWTDDHSAATTLWDHLAAIPGVLRIDSCRRSPDLGKWNISTTKEHYLSVTKWLDDNLTLLYDQLSAMAQSSCQFSEFPIPKRLSRSTPSASQHRASDKKSDYTKLLESRISTAPAVTVVQRTAWRPFQPVVDVSYAFNDQEFPPMKTQESIETKSTASTSHVSSLSEQAIRDAINFETAKLRIASEEHATGIDLRIATIERTLNDLTSNIVGQIYAKLSGSDSPFVTVIHLDAKLDRLSQQIAKLCLASQPPDRTVGSPPRKQARQLGPVEQPMAVDREPPDPIYE